MEKQIRDSPIQGASQNNQDSNQLQNESGSRIKETMIQKFIQEKFSLYSEKIDQEVQNMVEQH